MNQNHMAQMLGQGMAKSAANDLALRRRWLRLQELKALGELKDDIPDDYNQWRKMQLQGNG